jgi:O-antigen/teichoic acid export membrane protein
VKRRLARGAFWALSGSAIARLSGMLAAMIVARCLGRSGFGRLGMVVNTSGMFGSLAGFGLGLMVAKYVAEFRSSDPAKAGRIVTLSEGFAILSGISMAVILVLMAPSLARGTLSSAELAQPLRISAVLLFCNALIGAQTGTLSGLEAFRSIAKVNLVSGMVNLPLSAGGAVLGGLSGAIWGNALGALFNCFLNYRVMLPLLRRLQIPVPAPGALREWAVLWRISLPSTLGAAVVGPVTWFCSAILARQTNGYAELGLVSAANQWRAAILFLPATVGTAFLPILSGLAANKDWQIFEKTARRTVLFSLAIGSVIAIPVFAFSDLVMGGYGRGFAQGGPVLRYTVLAAAIYAANNQVTRISTSIDRAWAGAAFDLVWAVSFLVAGVFLINRFSATGFACALLISALVQGGAQGWFVTRLGRSRAAAALKFSLQRTVCAGGAIERRVGVPDPAFIVLQQSASGAEETSPAD